jgi:FG-GAP-like repeat/FG-GAP repeat/Dockerin type I domain
MRLIGIGAAVVLTASVAAAQAPMFRTASQKSLPGTIDNTFYLNTLIVADIGSNDDGRPDGIPDLITGNSNGVAPVLFGNGQGGFDTGGNVQIDTIPTAMALADVDHDNVPDLLVADSRKLRFLKGGVCFEVSNICFQDPAAAIDAGKGPAAILVTDLDGDQNPDAIVIDDADQQSGAAGAVTVLLGNGDGTFTFGGMYTTGIGSTAGVLGDFNRDGKTDVAVANAGSGDVNILLGDGKGGFVFGQVPKTENEPVAIAAANLNGDGFVDLVVLNRGSDSIVVLDGRQGGAFAAPRSFPSGSAGSVPNGMVLADVNADGKTDVVVANSRTNDASILLGNGRGSFAPPRAFVSDLEPQAVATGDFNSDGIPDVVTVNQGSVRPNAGLLLGIGDGSFVAVEDVITDPTPTQVAIGDVDNDGLPDLLVAEPGPSPASNGAVLVIRADRRTGFAQPTVLQSAGNADAVLRADFNADNRLDVAALNQAANSVSVFLGVAAGFAAPRNVAISGGSLAFAAGDWDGDGRDDLAVTRQGSGSTGAVETLLANADGSFRTGSVAPVGMNPVSADVGDFNHDGRRDLVVANSGSNDVAVLLGNGDGTFQAATFVGNDGGPRAVVVADFDLDGANDFAVARSLNPTVTVFYGDGQGGFASGGQVGSSGSAVAARDVNGDGAPDILVTDISSAVVSAYYSTGASTTGSKRQFRHDSRFDDVIVSRGPASVASGDIDGDGRYDVMTANGAAAGTASVLTNIGATPVVRGDGNRDERVSVADVLAVFREFADGRGRRVEDVQVAGGTYMAGAGIDANGDGFVTAQDALAVTHELFPGI